MPRSYCVELTGGALVEEVGERALGAEELLFPDVRPAVLATALLGPLLEAEELPRRIERRRLAVAHQLAEIEEVLLRRLPLAHVYSLPLLDELARRHEVLLGVVPAVGVRKGQLRADAIRDTGEL